MKQADTLEGVAPYDEVVAQHLAELPIGPTPRDVPCPLCGAGIGLGCSSTRTGYRARIHVPRWRAVGVLKPSFADRNRDYWDGERRNLEARKALHQNPSWLTDRAARQEKYSSTEKYEYPINVNRLKTFIDAAVARGEFDLYSLTPEQELVYFGAISMHEASIETHEWAKQTQDRLEERYWEVTFSEKPDDAVIAG